MRPRYAGYRSGEAVCRALGLNPDRVSRLTLDFRAGDLCEIRVERILLTDDMDGLLPTLERYRLVPVEDEEGNR